MIPVNDVIPENLYSQDDSPFLLGGGFSKAAAKEAICEACRSGQLKARKRFRRWWFSGREFLDWVSRWYGAGIGVVYDRGVPTGDRLAPVLPLGQDERTKQRPVAVRKGGR